MGKNNNNNNNNNNNYIRNLGLGSGFRSAGVHNSGPFKASVERIAFTSHPEAWDPRESCHSDGSSHQSCLVDARAISCSVEDLFEPPEVVLF